jgi:hypothetical protein
MPAETAFSLLRTDMSGIGAEADMRRCGCGAQEQINGS